MRRAKISIIGAGNVGATTAHIAAIKGLGDITLLDISEGIPQGKALDISQAMPLEGVDAVIKGTNKYSDTAGSDICVITAGIPRKPGMSRDDLLKTNTEIVSQVSKGIREYSPDSIIIVVSNPLDAMVYVAHKVTGFSKERVIGMAGILDSARFRHLIASDLNVSEESVSALVLGGHGDQMMPMARLANVAGIPISHFMDNKKIEKIIESVRNGGIEIVNLLKTGSAYYAPASSVCEMIESIVKDKKKILPCAAYLDGEYGTKGVFMGVPVKLGSKGAEEIIEIALDENEMELFQTNAKNVKELMVKTGL
ncbi:malate dehydrogenase [Candidatus Woesearchaeota archaeon]|nr:malate dehydrogenase [Candidatus Woesearchaeota archaeon]